MNDRCATCGKTHFAHFPDPPDGYSPECRTFVAAPPPPTFAIYLASRFSRNEEMRGVRDVLEGMGHRVTSRWIDLHGGDQLESAAQEVLNSDPESVAHFGVHDLEDLDAADVLISFTGAGGKGGRHVEHGYALGRGKRVIVVGPRENIFHTLPGVEHFATWFDFIARGPLTRVPVRVEQATS